MTSLSDASMSKLSIRAKLTYPSKLSLMCLLSRVKKSSFDNTSASIRYNQGTNFLLLARIHLQMSSLDGQRHSQSLAMAAFKVIIQRDLEATAFQSQATRLVALPYTIYLASFVAYVRYKPKCSSENMSTSLLQRSYSQSKRSAIFSPSIYT